MTEEELQKLNEAFQYPFYTKAGAKLVCFLTCLYDTPQEIDPDEVFYNGAGGFISVTDEEMDYLAANGYNMPANWREYTFPDGTINIWPVFLKTSTIDDILMKRLGITLSEVELELGSKYHMEWVPEFDAYYTRGRGDTNVWNVLFQTGVYIGDDTYVVDYCPEMWIGILGEGTYRVTFTMTNNDPDTIMFISNVKLG